MTNSIENLVHNHGPADGRGLGCGERIVDGRLRGWCMILAHRALMDLVEAEEIKQLTSDGYGGDFETTMEVGE